MPSGEEFRRKVREAQAAQAHVARTARGRPRRRAGVAAVSGPGMVRKLPPPPERREEKEE